MAELIREEDHLVLKLSTLEKVEGVHGDISVPISSVQNVTVLDDVIHEVHGIKFPGARLPGVFAMGTFISREGKAFALVHHKTKRGLKITLTNESFDILIVGVDEPEKVSASLGFSKN